MIKAGARMMRAGREVGRVAGIASLISVQTSL
jgi:hypothetical protein